MSVDFGTVTVHGWDIRHEDGEWGVRWPDGTVRRTDSSNDAYAAVRKHRANGITHTNVAVRQARVIVGPWEDADGLILLGVPNV